MKIFVLATSLDKKTITISKNVICYYKIINNHISHLNFTQGQETNKTIVLRFKTLSDYLQGFNIIFEQEKNREDNI